MKLSFFGFSTFESVEIVENFLSKEFDFSRICRIAFQFSTGFPHFKAL